MKKDKNDTKTKNIQEKPEDKFDRSKDNKEDLDVTSNIDISFMEGKDEKKKKKQLEKTVRQDVIFRKKISRLKVINNFLVVIIFILIGMFVYSYFYKDKEVKVKVQEKEVIKFKNDQNIVFIGDYILNDFKVEDYLKDIKFVNKSNDIYDSKNIINDLKDSCYIYNPSKVFIEVGINDILNDNKENIISNLELVIKDIKNNRKQASIYILSILPIRDKDIDNRKFNQDIRNINNNIRELCDKEKVTYIDLFTLIGDDLDILKDEYSSDGRRLNDKAYKDISELLNKYIMEE